MQFLPPHKALIRHALRPARGGAGVVVLVFAVLLSLAAGSGSLVGLPAALILTSWFFKYAYILFDHTSRGFDEPPVLDIQMMNPLDEQRPAAQLVILGLIAAAVIATRMNIGLLPAMVLAGVAGVFLPASVAILGLEGHLLRAANPVAWVRMMWGLGPLYGWVLLLIVIESLFVALLGRLDLWLSVRIAAGMFFVLSLFSLLGGSCYERRHELGLETWVSPERTADKEKAQALRDAQTRVTEAYGLMRAGSHVECWETLQRWLNSRGNTVADYHWLCERLVSWGDPRYVTRMTEEYVARLLALKRTGEALDVVTERLRADPAFRPKSAADTLSLAQLAARGGGAPRVARQLLSDFSARFAGDPRVMVAESLARHLGS
jgi:hypothetical protein